MIKRILCVVNSFCVLFCFSPHLPLVYIQEVCHMDFSDTLRMLIEEKDITQKELAKQLHLAPSTLGSYVQGSREPDFSTLKQIADYFEVSTDYLLGHYTASISSPLENELLRVFRSLTEEQQYICIEQNKVFMKSNTNIKHRQKKYL